MTWSNAATISEACLGSRPATKTAFEASPRVEYALTPRGRAFVPVLEALRTWAEGEFGDDR